MASVRNKLIHEELAEGKAAQEVELEPEFDIDEDKPESRIIVDDDLRAERFEEFPASRHLDKCKFRCCAEFDVTLQHMSKVVRDLNGRKVDGVFVNDVIGRYGFYNGVQINRAALASKYKRSVEELEFVHDKVKAIVQHEDFKAAYEKYVDGMKKEVIKDIDDKTIYGE